MVGVAVSQTAAVWAGLAPGQREESPNSAGQCAG